jgi:DNA-binding IclR family transcriptional regulator
MSSTGEGASGVGEGAFEDGIGTSPDSSVVRLPQERTNDEFDGIELDQITVPIPGDRAVVFAAQVEATHARWGRRLANLTTSEMQSLLQKMDPVARAVIETKRLTGALVELHPEDREMFKRGFKAISEEGGWLQANFRDRGQVARLMRIRPGTGVAVLSGGALVLAAVAAQAQAAEMAQDIEAIGQQVDLISKHQKDDQIGAVEHAVGQSYDLVEMLRAHGKDGVTESDISVARNTLGDARHKCVQHLKTAVQTLEDQIQGSVRQAEQVLSADAVEDVMLYLHLAGRLDSATVQFGYAQVAFDCHGEKADVAATRAAQVTRAIDRFRADIEDVLERLGRLDEDIRAQFLPLWKHAGREIGAKVGFGTVAGAGSGAALAATPVATEAIKDSVDGSEGKGDDTSAERPPIAKLAVYGAVIGFVGGFVLGTRDTVREVQARKPLEERLGRLATASSQSQEIIGKATPRLDWLHALTGELAELGGLTDPMVLPVSVEASPVLAEDDN